MKLNTRAFALAAGSFTAFAFVLKMIFFAIAPRPMLNFASYVSYLNVQSLYRPITWESFIVGLIVWTLSAAITAGAVAWLYNLFISEREYVPVSKPKLTPTA